MNDSATKAQSLAVDTKGDTKGQFEPEDMQLAVWSASSLKNTDSCGIFFQRCSAICLTFPAA
jgi:hypothetical protein